VGDPREDPLNHPNQPNRTDEVTLALRILLAVALVLLTWNPSGTSYLDWVLHDKAGHAAVKAFAGVALLGGWLFCLRTAWVSLGSLGVLIGAALLGTFVWMLFELGVITAKGATFMTWLALVAVGVLLGVGLSWSIIRRKFTGQVEVD
jgi:hypothetical protein